MAIFYSKLTTAVARWTKRDDLAAIVPDYILIAEAEIMRRVRIMEMETDTTITCASPDYEGALPADFLGFRHVFVDAANPRATYVAPDTFHTLNNIPGDQYRVLLGDAELLYTVEAGKIKVNRPAGSLDPITLNVTFFERFRVDPDGDLGTQTNALLDDHYDIYLWATLCAAWDDVDETEMVAKYTAKLDRAIEQLHEHERRRRNVAGPLKRTNADRSLA